VLQKVSKHHVSAADVAPMMLLPEVHEKVCDFLTDLSGLLRAHMAPYEGLTLVEIDVLKGCHPIFETVFDMSGERTTVIAALRFIASNDGVVRARASQCLVRHLVVAFRGMGYGAERLGSTIADRIGMDRYFVIGTWFMAIAQRLHVPIAKHLIVHNSDAT